MNIVDRLFEEFVIKCRWNDLVVFVVGLLSGLLIMYVGSCAMQNSEPGIVASNEVRSLRYDLDQMKSQLDDYKRILQSYNTEHIQNEDALKEDLQEIRERMSK